MQTTNVRDLELQLFYPASVVHTSSKQTSFGSRRRVSQGMKNESCSNREIHVKGRCWCASPRRSSLVRQLDGTRYLVLPELQSRARVRSAMARPLLLTFESGFLSLITNTTKQTSDCICAFVRIEQLTSMAHTDLIVSRLRMCSMWLEAVQRPRTRCAPELLQLRH